MLKTQLVILAPRNVDVELRLSVFSAETMGKGLLEIFSFEHDDDKMFDIFFCNLFDATWYEFKLSLRLCPLSCCTANGVTSLSNNFVMAVFFAEWLATFDRELWLTVVGFVFSSERLDSF